MDEKGFHLKGRLFVGVEVISIAIASILTALNAPTIIPGIDGRWIVLAWLIIFAISVVLHINRLSVTLDDRAPNIKMIKPIVERGVRLRNTGLETPFGKSDRTSNPTYYAHIGFSNLPKHPTELNHAMGVVASLTYFDAKGRVLVDTIYGQWSKAEAPKQPNQVEGLIRRQIKSDGVPENLVVACKPVESESCYAFNNDSWFFPDLLIDPSFELTEQVVYVNINLRGERVNKNFRLRLYNEGKGGSMQLEEDKSWLKRLINRK